MRQNYSGNKKRREEAKRKKQEEKRNRRLNKKNEILSETPAAPETVESSGDALPGGTPE